MNPVPVMLRCRIAALAASAYPRGLTSTSVFGLAGNGVRAYELREVMDRMVADGILRTRMDPPPPHRAGHPPPLRVYVASPALRGEARCGRG